MAPFKPVKLKKAGSRGEDASEPKELLQIHFPSLALRFVKANVDAQNILLHYLKGVTGEVIKEERVRLHPGMLFREIEVNIVLAADWAEGNTA